ncbi:MAG: acetylxylan esterase, partial [Planctomycetales bacterium]|nr:acetylxylan esterase [Planctomycetales bacterium]
RFRVTVWLGLLLLVSCLSAPAAFGEPIVGSAALPETTPWDLRQLGEAPKFEWESQQGPVHSLYYQGLPYQGHATRVFAYYANPETIKGNADATDTAKPSADKQRPWPAVVLIHGGGGTAFREWAELWAKRGYAAIAMDLAGYRPIEGQNPHQRDKRTRLEDGGPDQGDDEKFGSVDKPPGEQWPYHAVANVLLAHSLIREFPEVDGDRTAVTGISWGGYLTCIVAGVDSRFKAAVPVYGCGHLHEHSAWLSRFDRMTPEQRDRWVTLWDPSRYLPAVSMPILFVNGTNDFAYPLDSYMKCYRLVPGDKQMRVTVNMPHSHPAGWNPSEIGLFVDQHLRGGDPLPKLAEPSVTEGRVTCQVTNGVSLKEAALHFATDAGPINKRQWQTVPAEVQDKVVTVDAPPAEATVWFVTAADTRGAVISSVVRIRE